MSTENPHHIFLKMVVNKKTKENGQATSEWGRSVLTGELISSRVVTKEYAEIKNDERSILRLFAENCSGWLEVEQSAILKVLEISACFQDCVIFSAKYDVLGNLYEVCVDAGLPQSVDDAGTINGDGLLLNEEEFEGFQTRLVLNILEDETVNRAYEPEYYSQFEPEERQEISSQAWQSDTRLVIKKEERMFVLDWSGHETIQIEALLPSGIYKYGQIPKKLTMSQVSLFADHLDQVKFPIEAFSWQIWWGDLQGGRDEFE